MTVNVAVVAPAATVTDAGTVALVELELKVTAMPPEGAAPLSVTVPVELVPPRTDVGETERETRDGGLTVNVAVLDVPLRIPVMVA